MQRNLRSYCRLRKSPWKIFFRQGTPISPGVTTVKAAFLRQLGLQTGAADVSIRVQKGPIHVPGDISRETIQSFEAARLTEPGERNNVDAVMQASVAANRELYENLRRCNPFMCEALRELMKEEIEREIEEETRKAALQADQKARQKKSIELIRNLMETMKMTADQAMAAMKIPNEDRKEYMARL